MSTDTEALIQTLARDPAVRTRPMYAALGLCVAGMLTYSVLAVIIIAGARPDIAAQAPWVVTKAGLSLLFAMASAPLLLRLAQPGRGAGLWLPGLALLLAACILLTAGELATIANDARVKALTGGGFPLCAVVIPTLAAPAGGLLFFWLRRQAPTRPVLAGMAAGVLAGATAAMAYALTCPVDSMPFITTWYPAAIVICAAIGSIAGALMLRW